MLNFFRVLPSLFMLLLLGACSGLPASGPTANEVANGSEDWRGAALSRYLIVAVDERVVSLEKLRVSESIYASFGDHRGSPGPRIGVGDTVQVTIWEASAGGLFSPQTAVVSTGAPSTIIPVQVVGRDGTISVPFVNRINVLGLTPAELERRIVKALEGKAIEPSALVTVPQRASGTVTVTGEGTGGARVPLSERGDRILDVIASVGGLRIKAYEAQIRLTRRRHTVSVPFSTLLKNPRENIFVQPDDVVTVVQEPPSFTAFGATGRNASVEFGTAALTLENALAKAGGLLDIRADPQGVFLFRRETPAFARALAGGRPLPPPIEGRIPVIYQVDLRDARAFLLAESFPVANRDIVYVANADAAQLLKFVQLIGSVVSPGLTTVTAAGRV